MHPPQIFAELSRLYALEVDAAQAYSAAVAEVIARPNPAGVRARLVALRDDEERHLQWAERMVSRRVWLQPDDAHP